MGLPDPQQLHPNSWAIQQSPPQSVWRSPRNRRSATLFRIWKLINLIFLVAWQSRVNFAANSGHRQSGSVNSHRGGTPLRQATESFSGYQAGYYEELQTAGGNPLNHSTRGGASGLGYRERAENGGLQRRGRGFRGRGRGRGRAGATL